MSSVQIFLLIQLFQKVFAVTLSKKLYSVFRLCINYRTVPSAI